ncbi:MAG TPA: M1 family metallopeptidase [Thermoanaerobaculia bacterium]|nr:M1 family metallopeptidase [Thermoanaerobaculia bacterium]
MKRFEVIRMRRSTLPLSSLLPVLLLAACSGQPQPMDPAPAPAAAPAAAAPAATQTAPAAPAAAPDRDPHSFSRPDEVVVQHLKLDLNVDFSRRQLSGRASLRLDNRSGANRLVLDTRDLEIRQVLLDSGTAARYTLGEEVEFLGRPLEVEITPRTQWVHVDYSTRPEAAALQWLDPQQTAGGRHPFLLTQSQAILARTWIPLQDTPGVRMTYEATVRVPQPQGLLALMSAENPTAKRADGTYTFKMPQPIPSYLMALAVGDLEFRPLGPNSGVYAEPPVIELAAWELADTPRMITTAERLFGPYRWGRYDMLVLPPSFPYGGMENPRLTFLTPTMLARDRSLVSLIAHELAHSWSGNLVTNATWNDFWLNEGFTTYAEGRIMEALYGNEYADMLAVLGRQDLDDAFEEMGGPQSPDTHLFLALAGRDPDEGTSNVAYEKGALFLRMLEQAVGREAFDRFLRGYFDSHAFQSIDTTRFVALLKRDLLGGNAQRYASLRIDQWIYGPGVPDNAPQPRSTAFAAVDAAVAAFAKGTPAAQLGTQGWTTHHWLHFLRTLPKPLSREQMADLDAAFKLSQSGNSEILTEWLVRVVENRYDPVYPVLERFLTSVGRTKFLRPIYTAMAKTPAGADMALRIYEKARPGYHAVSRAALEKILDWQG